MNKLFVENLQHCCHWTRSQCSHRKYAPRYQRAAPSKFRQVFPSLEALTIWWGVPREYNRLFGRYSWLNNNSPNLTFRWVINFGKRLTSTRIVCMYSWCNILPIISSYDYFNMSSVFLIQNISKKNLRKVVVMNVYVDIFNENGNKMKWMWILYEVEIVGQIRSIR